MRTLDPLEIVERFFGFIRENLGDFSPWLIAVGILFLLGRVLKFQIGLRG